MELVKEMKIQSYAVLFGSFRVASKIPKVFKLISINNSFVLDVFSAEYPLLVYESVNSVLLFFFSVGSWKISQSND